MMKPENEAELAQMVANANAALQVVGGGSRRIGLPQDCDHLNTSLLSGITLYEPGALTLVAQAGTSVSEIEKALESEGQRLAFEPADHRALMQTKGMPTIGGIVATNTSGPRRISVGACRDFLLGVRFVDGMGRVLKNGGRVMKNVTGYDLVKLMAGSYGTLGVLSEVSLKVLPIAERAATVTIAGLTDVQAVRVMSAALGSPYDVTGAAHSQVGDSAQALTMLRLEGFEGSVTYRAQKLRELLAPFGSLDIVTDDTKVQAMWRRVRDVEGFAAKTGNVWKISVKPSDAPELVARLGADEVMYDWGGGLIWALAPTEIDLRAVMAGTAGHATLVRGEGFAKFHPEPAAVAALSAGIRQKFDPRGFLNPGLMG